MSIQKIVVSRKVIRNCIWCSAPMPTLRSSKKTCSDSCYNAMSYQNRKFYKMSGEKFVAFLEAMIKNGNHINLQHPLHQGEAT